MQLVKYFSDTFRYLYTAPFAVYNLFFQFSYRSACMNFHSFTSQVYDGIKRVILSVCGVFPDPTPPLPFTAFTSHPPILFNKISHFLTLCDYFFLKTHILTIFCVPFDYGMVSLKRIWDWFHFYTLVPFYWYSVLLPHLWYPWEIGVGVYEENRRLLFL